MGTMTACGEWSRFVHVSRRILDFDDPDRFAAAAIGEPGERLFFLHAKQGARAASVLLEREQVEILADRMLAVVDELERRGLAAIEPSTSSVVDDVLRAEQLQEDFQANVLTIAWDDDVDRLIVEARSEVLDEGAGEAATRDLESLDEDVPDDAPIGPDVLRVHLKPSMAQHFARQAGRVVADRRPPCPICGRPLDPFGHVCPRPEPPEYLH